mmetsp:Transcript_22229/g.56512  ORF Transcript_22229/g.56512 Transcript_22229/m.56512 type:complete len:215 (-) Transcript_22229:57-701(-)
MPSPTPCSMPMLPLCSHSSSPWRQNWMVGSRSTPSTCSSGWVRSSPSPTMTDRKTESGHSRAVRANTCLMREHASSLRARSFSASSFQCSSASSSMPVSHTRSDMISSTTSLFPAARSCCFSSSKLDTYSTRSSTWADSRNLRSIASSWVSFLWARAATFLFAVSAVLVSARTIKDLLPHSLAATGVRQHGGLPAVQHLAQALFRDVATAAIGF